MNTTERLAFRLVIAEPNTDERTITVCPRYDGLKLKWSRPSGQVYYTEDISGTLKFLGVDFHTLNACALNTQFTLIVYQNRVEVGRSLFRKTDCKWDIDHGVVEVDISVYDEYKKFQDKKDDEYNLIKLGLEKKAMSLYVFPQNQVYFQDDNVISLWGTSATSAQPTVTPTHDDGSLVGGMHFASFAILGAVRCSVSGTDYDFTIKTKFEDYTTTVLTQYKCVFLGNAGSNTKVYFGYYSNNVTYYKFVAFMQFRLILTDAQSGTLVAWSDLTRLDQLYSLTGMGALTIYTTSRFWVAYGGMVTMLQYTGHEIPTTDITSDFNKNYKSRITDTIQSTFIIAHSAVSTTTSDTDKGYGQVEGTNLYYDKPDETQNWKPVRRESWFGGFSLWVGDMNTSYAAERFYRASNTVKDFYLFTDAIRAVVQKIDPDVQFDDSDSWFLTEANNPVSGQPQGALYISQKSNVLNLGYDYPAWLAPVKWSQIETLLREAFDCYWSLYDRDGHKHLRIEHRRWYENGGNYTQSGVQVATIDLTSTFRNSTPFTFGEKTRHWEFDTDGNGTVSTASRHEYGWMDTQSEIFDGQPITVPEAYRLFTDEKVEQHKVDWFSSDIDFLTSVQAECSSDGFVVVMENPNQPNWIITGAAEYSGQNYQLSFDYLQDKYLLQGIYAEVVMIGDNETLTNSNARMRTSDVQMRSVDGMEINASDTIKTAVGIGVIDTLEYDLHSQLYTVKLRYENE